MQAETRRDNLYVFMTCHIVRSEEHLRQLTEQAAAKAFIKRCLQCPLRHQGFAGPCWGTDHPVFFGFLESLGQQFGLGREQMGRLVNVDILHRNTH